MLKVAVVAEVLQIVIVDTTVDVEAGTVYKVLAVPIVPLPSIAPRRLYVVVIFYAPINKNVFKPASDAVKSNS